MKKINVIIVTSTINYTPDNYTNTLLSVVGFKNINITGVIFIKIDVKKLLFKIPLLYFMGVKKIAKTLLKNICKNEFHIKEKVLKQKNIDYIYTYSINDKKTQQWISEKSPDLIFNMRTRSIYNSEVLDIPNLGCFNIHHGLMPCQKGLFCDLHAISRGEETGVTIHKMNKNIDDGEIVVKQIVLNTKNYILYLKNLEKIEANTIKKFFNIIICKKQHLNNRKCKKTIFVTTTPTKNEIKKFIKQGIIL